MARLAMAAEIACVAYLLSMAAQWVREHDGVTVIKGDVMKKAALIFVATVVVLAAAIFASSRVFAASGPPSAAASSAAPAGPCSDVALYGHIKSLTRKGDRFELRFDAAWFLSGVTASRAKLEDTGSSDVPNDNYVVEEGHRLLTYLVPATADITVLSRTGELPGAGFPSTAITASQLAQLVDGQESVKLAEPLQSGFWMHVKVDTVCSLQQQYRP
jgi:hypothetical protein